VTLAPERVPESANVAWETDEVQVSRFMDISHAVDLWLGHLEGNKGRAPKTVASYRRIADKLADDLPGVDVGEVTTTQLRRFLVAHAHNAHPWRAGKPKASGTRAIEVTVLNSLFDWLTFEQVIKTNPTRRHGMRILDRPPVGRPEDNDNIVSISSSDVRKLIDAALDWDEKLIIYTLAYLGPRRHALALAKLADYDQAGAPPTIKFREKGRKTIAKPVPAPLVDIIAAACAAGVYDEQDWLVPNRKPGQAGAVWLPSLGEDERDDRFVWRTVRRLGDRAGVRTHTHALRAAFAVFFLESGGDKYDLQLLMGHSSGSTTDVYLRRLDKRKRMESVLTLNYGDPA
jgi:integrase